MTLRYTAGPGVGVARGDVVVLLPGTPEPRTVGRLWEALDPEDGAEPGVLDALGVLTSDAGTALASLPPFAVVAVRGGQAHALVRGACAVVVETADGHAATIEGTGVATWTERLVSDVVGVTVRADGDHHLLAVGGTWPLESGVVATTAVGLRLGRAAEEGGAQEPRVAGVEPMPLAVWAEPEAEPEAPPFAAVVEPEPASPVAQQGLSASEGVADGGDPEPADETYGHLWGSTVPRAVEAAAVRPEGEDDPASTPVPDGLIAGVPRWDAPGDAPATDPAEVPAAAPAEVPADAPGGVTRDVPAAPAPPAGPPAPSVIPDHEPSVIPDQTMPPEQTTAGPPVGDLDHDGSTVLSSAIADLRAAAAAVPVEGAVSAAAPGPRGPQILARTCAQGHVNPPTRAACRHCGQPLDCDAALAERPVLGRLRVSTGEDVPLDRPVVVGRRPRAPRASDGSGARLVTVPSPSQDISRSHVEVRLDGWHVLVADLATTNGTVLLRTGQAPLRLHPNEGVLVVDGDVVDLGDGVVLTFEEVW